MREREKMGRRCALMLAVTAGLVGCAGEEAGEVAVGEAVPSLLWEGYVNEDADGVSTNQPFSDYGTDALIATGSRYAMLHTSETF